MMTWRLLRMITASVRRRMLICRDNRFHGQAEEVGNVAAAEGQVVFDPAVFERAGHEVQRDLEKEARDALAGGLAADGDQPLAGLVEVAQGLVHDLPFEVAIGLDEPGEDGPGHLAEDDVRRGFGAERGRGSIEPADEVARELEPHHLLATVLEHL